MDFCVDGIEGDLCKLIYGIPASQIARISNFLMAKTDERGILSHIWKLEILIKTTEKSLYNMMKKMRFVCPPLIKFLRTALPLLQKELKEIKKMSF